MPIALLLLFALKYNKTSIWGIHSLGLTFIADRLIQARGLLSENLKGPVVGMQITIFYNTRFGDI